MTLKEIQHVDTQALTDDKFDSMITQFITDKFHHQPDRLLERKPKADKGV